MKGSFSLLIITFFFLISCEKDEGTLPTVQRAIVVQTITPNENFIFDVTKQNDTIYIDYCGPVVGFIIYIGNNIDQVLHPSNLTLILTFTDKKCCNGLNQPEQWATTYLRAVASDNSYDVIVSV